MISHKTLLNSLHMRRQRTFLQKLATTNGARMWNSSVKLSMIDQLELAGEGGSAVSASERIDRAVEPRMHVQVLLLSETLAAVLEG